MHKHALILHLAGEIIDMRLYGKKTRESILRRYWQYNVEDSDYAKALKIADKVWNCGVNSLTGEKS